MLAHGTEAIASSTIHVQEGRLPEEKRESWAMMFAAYLVEATEYGFTNIDGKQPRPLTLADM